VIGLGAIFVALLPIDFAIHGCPKGAVCEETTFTSIFDGFLVAVLAVPPLGAGVVVSRLVRRGATRLRAAI
jgi:hypothetical protein